MPYRGGSRRTPALMRVLETIGSDPDNFECPRCGSHDRERHLLMYMEATGLLREMFGKSVLHFAPERHLSESIRAESPRQYVRCDLYPNSTGVERVDILDMPFERESFDAVIANHVLEHVSDDLQAVREVHRVLRRGGYAILQTPYSSKLQHTWQDPGIDDAKIRLQAHGQEDHARLFGHDIFERIASAGLQSDVRQHGDVLSKMDADRFGVNPKEPFFLFHKPR